MDEVCTWRQVRESIRLACHPVYIQFICMHAWWHYVMILCMTVWVYAEVAGSAVVTIHLRPGASRCTAQVNFSSGQVPLSGSPMWFHLDRQGLQLQSADSLSGHRVGAVQGKAPVTGYAAGSITHIMAHTSLLATGAPWPLWCLTALSECVTGHWSLTCFFSYLGW